MYKKVSISYNKEMKRMEFIFDHPGNRSSAWWITDERWKSEPQQVAVDLERIFDNVLEEKTT